MNFVFREQLQLAIRETSVDRFKRVFGYVASIKLADIAGTDTPACCQVILKLPFIYGCPPRENVDSFLYVMVNAYTSSLCMGIPTRVFRIGDIVSGFLEASSSECNSAHLTGWDHANPHLWRAISPATYPSIFTIHTSAVFLLPQLAADNMPT